ncbi:MAG TPA: hypothetical protein PLN18_01965 [Candidatus Colwellbacteria bacterium]|nr:hypothetical protein [Candidatus Colwellbacteria bacterium]HQA96111.1 hypothetical protein [Candidatus Colwellbacteria bacterium]
MKQIESQLKNLRKIRPDKGFALMCREDLLSSTVVKPGIDLWRNLGLSLSLALTAMLVVFVAQNAAVSSYSIASLEKFEEETTLSRDQINITLAEINYHSDLASKTSMALSEAAAEGPSHLNQNLLMKEAESLKIDSAPDNVDILLDQVIL